jgi:hypothetical protein
MSGKHRLEHHKRAHGGEAPKDELDRKEEGEGKEEDYSGSSNVAKEAKERKKGGRVKDCMPERKHGGKVKEEHRVEGKLAKMHMGRPGRKAGGRVGSDKSPLSSAHSVSGVVEHRTDD